MLICHLGLNRDGESVRIQKTERGVQKNERCRVRERVSALHWDDLDLLRGVSTANSLRQAALQLGLSVNTVRARISRLEEALGTLIIDRGKDRSFLTKQGIEVLDIAIEMQMLRGQLQFGSGNNSVVNSGEISISCTEGLGEFWLSSFVPLLQDKIPGYVISLNNDFDQSRIHSNKFDISIGFTRPNDQDAIVKKLAMLHLMPFVSGKYVEKYGMPQSLDDLDNHTFVSQVAPGLNDQAIDIFVGSVKAEQFVTLKVNTSFSLFRAILNGEAIGVLPTYAAAISKDVIPLDLPVLLRFDLWMSFNRSAKNSIPVRHAITWLEECFNQSKFPWFSDEFLHPTRFSKNTKEDLFLGQRDDVSVYSKQAV